MFNFFKRRREEKAAREAKEETFRTMVGDLQSGQGNFLEAAVALHLHEQNQESTARLIITLGSSEVFTINRGPERLEDTAVTQGPEGEPYVAVFSSEKKAQEAVSPPYDRIARLSVLEILFAMRGNCGLVINPFTPALRWTFSAEQALRIAEVLQTSFSYTPGVLYTVWSRGSYHVVKMLHVDEVGVHIRLYGNTWPERPEDVDFETLHLSSEPGGPVRAIGHMPLQKAPFLAMGPIRLKESPVTEEELDGYRTWQEAKGGYFG